MIGDLLSISALMMFPLIFIFGYPLVALVQCWSNKNISSGKKIGWTVFILITWPMFSIGGFAYGLVEYKGYYRVAPIAFLCAALALMWVGSMQVINLSYDVAFQSIEGSNIDPEYKKRLYEQVVIIQSEADKSDTPEVNAMIVNYLSQLLTDGLTKKEYASWERLYSKRNDLSDQDIEYLRDFID
jgi:hypothetical protein